MTDTPGATKERETGSELLYRMDRIAARPMPAVLVVAADLVWVLWSAVFGFPSRWESVFQTLVAALTLAMVFVIQHTQSREQRATQRKLDEILRAIPRADNALIAFEDASDVELSTTHEAHRRLRREAVGAESDPSERDSA